MPVDKKDKITKEGIAKAAEGIRKAIEKEKKEAPEVARAHMVEAHAKPEKKKHAQSNIAQDAAIEARGRMSDAHLGISRTPHADRLKIDKQPKKIHVEILKESAAERKERIAKEKMKSVHKELYEREVMQLRREKMKGVVHKELLLGVDQMRLLRENLLSKIDKIEAVLEMVLDGVPELESYVKECARELRSARVDIETGASGLKTHLHKLLDTSAKKLNSIQKSHAPKTSFGSLVKLLHKLFESFCALFSNKKPEKETMFRPSSHEAAKHQLRGFNNALESIYGEIHELTADKENRHLNKHQ